jgi:hypothetical protein
VAWTATIGVNATVIETIVNTRFSIAAIGTVTLGGRTSRPNDVDRLERGFLLDAGNWTKKDSVSQ